MLPAKGDEISRGYRNLYRDSGYMYCTCLCVFRNHPKINPPKLSSPHVRRKYPFNNTPSPPQKKIWWGELIIGIT